MYPNELMIKYDGRQYFCFLFGYAREGGQLFTSLYAKRDEFFFQYQLLFVTE